LWFRLALQQPERRFASGSLGHGFRDPDTLGNGYRWLAKRINAGPDGGPKDAGFVAPFFSVFEDRFVNGLTFDFNFARVPFPSAMLRTTAMRSADISSVVTQWS
jgi:hypothetical protein